MRHYPRVEAVREDLASHKQEVELHMSTGSQKLIQGLKTELQELRAEVDKKLEVSSGAPQSLPDAAASGQLAQVQKQLMAHADQLQHHTEKLEQQAAQLDSVALQVDTQEDSLLQKADMVNKELASLREEVSALKAAAVQGPGRVEVGDKEAGAAPPAVEVLRQELAAATALQERTAEQLQQLQAQVQQAQQGVTQLEVRLQEQQQQQQKAGAGGASAAAPWVEDSEGPELQAVQDTVVQLQQRLQRTEDLFGEAKAQLEAQVTALVQGQQQGAQVPPAGAEVAGAAGDGRDSDGQEQSTRGVAAQLQELRAMVDTLNAQVDEYRLSMASSRSGSYITPARAAANASDAAEAAVDLASALEDKVALLDRLVRAATATMTSVETSLAAALQRIDTLEQQVPGGVKSLAGSEALGGGTDLAESKDGEAEVGGTAGTPQALAKAQASLAGMKKLLANHSDRVAYLEDQNTKTVMAMEQLRVDMLDSKMKMLETSGGGAKGDDTSASHAEVEALSQRLQHMQDTLVETLMRMDSNIASTAIKAIQGELGKSGGLASPGAHAGGDSGGDKLLGGDGNVAGGSNSSALKVLNPQRDKLAAALLETDGKVSAMEETVQSVQAAQESLKAGQVSLKLRLKELAEALVSLSNKAQDRISKLERRSDMGEVVAGGSGALDGDGERSSKALRQSGVQPVSAALKQLDSSSGQLAGMSRILAKRIDDMEERLARAEAKAAGRPAGPSTSGAAQPEPSVLRVLEEDVKGLGQDVVALHNMLQRTEAALRQAIMEECVSRNDLALLQQQLEATNSQKDAMILKVAQQIDVLMQRA